MSERFHVNSALAPGILTMRGTEAHHLAVVSRVRVNETVCLFNGDGHEYLGRVVEIGKRDVTIEILSSSAPSRELPHLLHFAVPLPKGDRAQFLVEKLTELGVHTLTVITTTRSVVHPRETKLEKLERYVIEASKQCRRNRLMQIEGPIPLPAFIQGQSLPENKLFAHPDEHQRSSPPLKTTPTVALIGPEGGFTEAEVEEMRASGWRSVALGPRILRVETAAVTLAARLSDYQ